MSDFDKMRKLMEQRAAEIWAGTTQPLVVATTSRPGYRQMFSTGYADAPVFKPEWFKLQFENDYESKEDDMPNIFKCDECGEIVKRVEVVRVTMIANRARDRNENYEEVPRVEIDSDRNLCAKCYGDFLPKWPFPIDDHSVKDDDE